MLQNAYFLAKIGADTAENEQHFAEILPSVRCLTPPLPALVHARALLRGERRGRLALEGPPVGQHRRRQRASVGKISAKRCSFSAVSAPIFASKYAFDSIFQNLPDSQADFLKFDKILQILRHLQFFAEISRKLLIFQTDFLRKF